MSSIQTRGSGIPIATIIKWGGTRENAGGIPDSKLTEKERRDFDLNEQYGTVLTINKIVDSNHLGDSRNDMMGYLMGYDA